MPSATRLQQELERLKAARSKAYARVKNERGRVTNTLSGAASAYVMGRVERSATRPLPTIAGIDHKLVYGLGLMAISMKGRGKWGDAIAGAGDGLISAYGYAEGRGVPVPFAQTTTQPSVQGYLDPGVDQAMGTLPSTHAEPFDVSGNGDAYLVGEEEDETSDIAV